MKSQALFMKLPNCIICTHFLKAGRYLRFNDVIKHLIEYFCLLNVLSFIIRKFNRTGKNLSDTLHLWKIIVIFLISVISNIACDMMKADLSIRFNDVVR